jgi:hypothetical protein
LNRGASDVSVARDQGQEQRERSGCYHATGNIRDLIARDSLQCIGDRKVEGSNGEAERGSLLSKNFAANMELASTSELFPLPADAKRKHADGRGRSCLFN